MDNWDDEDFEPAVPEGNILSDKWEGEDEDGALKDNWDDEEEEKKPKKIETPKPKQEPKKGGKKYLNQKLKEKEAEEKRLVEERKLKNMTETPEEKMANRLLAQKLSEESELEMMKGQFNKPEETGNAGKAFLDNEEIDPTNITIDSFQPRTKEDFTKFATLLKDKLLTLENSPHYFYLLETVISSAVIKLDAESLKKISSTITALSNEKLKLEKQQRKGGKKPQKAKLGGGIKAAKNEVADDYSQYDDFDDFM